MSKQLDEIKAEIASMRRGSQNQKSKPHKLVMLLAVLDLAEDNLLHDNQIHLDSALIERFRKNFQVYSDSQDWLQVGPPFFHLRSATFWFHKVKEGRHKDYESLTTSGGGTKRILDNIDYAYLSRDFLRVVNDSTQRAELRAFLINLLK